MTASPSIEFRVPEPILDDDRALGSDAEVVAAVRLYLDEVRAYLGELHREQPSGRVVNEAHTDYVDHLLRRLFGLAEAHSQSKSEGRAVRLSLVAVGGYARRELSIHSDLDLLFLYRRRLSPYVQSVSECLQRWLWDSGLTVGCSTRTIDETLALASEDTTVRTAVLDARYLVGDVELFHDLADAIREELFAQPGAFIAEHFHAMTERHVKYGESPYLLQPNVKEGMGGLRDFHTAYWVARAAHPETRRLDDLLHFGLLTEAEMNSYRKSLDFLWRLRNELHLVAGSGRDQISFELQEQIADDFGYGKEAGEDLPVERFMGEFYRHVRVVQNLSELVIEQCARRTHPSTPRAVRSIEDGFRLRDGHLEVPHAGHLRERPVRMLTAFELAQQHDVVLSRTARRLIREKLGLIDDAFRRDPEVVACFERILNAERRVMRTLMVMNELGLLSALFPEWEHIVCRWQQVIYHTYTVDVHSIFLVEELRRLWRRKYEAALPELTEIMREAVDRPALFLGCLFHDIGKGRGGDHSAVGVELVSRCLGRLGWPEERCERVRFLVRHHLLMSHLAQRRDLSDPKLIIEFARLVGDRVNLRNLYLLTFADIRASSRAAWTDWKGELLRELFERTSEVLEVGADDRERAIETMEARVETRLDSARRELRSLGISEAKIEGYFSIMPRRYFVSHTPRQIARHARVLLAFSEERLISTAVREVRGEFAELIVVARDVHGLYSNVAGVLTLKNLNILGSHVYTTRHGLALEIYRVTNPRGGEQERREVWRGVETTLHGVLSGVIGLPELFARRRRPIGKPRSPSQQPPTVSVSNAISDFYTVADISTDDRPGLLYDLTRTIAELGFEIYISKASTILDQVADTFYLKDAAGKKIQDPAQIERLREALLAATGDAELSRDD